jgi:hypothetical protein
LTGPRPLSPRSPDARRPNAKQRRTQPSWDARRVELARWADEAEEQTAERDQGLDDDLSAGL